MEYKIKAKQRNGKPFFNYVFFLQINSYGHAESKSMEDHKKGHFPIAIGSSLFSKRKLIFYSMPLSKS